MFEFVKRVRSEDNVWVSGFDSAKDIIAILRTQFAYLFREMLQTRLRLISTPHAWDITLSGKAFRLALERPKAWEFRLFAQVLIDEVDRHRDARREHLIGIAFGPGEDISIEEFFTWTRTRLDEIRRMASMLDTLVNDHLQRAFGPVGQPGNPAEIVFAARKVAECYRATIEWSQRLRRSHVDSRCQVVVDAMAGFVDDMLREIESFGPTVLRTIEEALVAPPTGRTREVNMTMRFRLSNLEAHQEALRELNRVLGLPNVDEEGV